MDFNSIFPLRVFSATVHITVNDVNEYGPKFSEASYVVDVDEGRPSDSVLQVDATDGDCSAKYGDICRYEIIGANDQPFSIDNEGTLLLLPLITLTTTSSATKNNFYKYSWASSMFRLP